MKKLILLGCALVLVVAAVAYIEMQNVGGEENGVTPEKALNLILAALYAQIQSPDVTAALNKGFERLGVTVKGVSVTGFEAKTQEALENVKDKVKGLLGD